MKRTPILYSILITLSLMAATQWLAWRVHYHWGLGGGMPLGSGRLYWPWQILFWSFHLSTRIPNALQEGQSVLALGTILSTISMVIISRAGQPIPIRQLGKNKWANRQEIAAAGLLGGSGTVLGKYGRQWLTYNGPEHQFSRTR